MKVEWTSKGRPVGCSHDVPSERSWFVVLGVEGVGIGALIGGSLGQAHVGLVYLALGLMVVAAAAAIELMRQSRRQLYQGTLAHVFELNHLLEAAHSYRIELPALPMKTPGQMTNAELKRWAREANDHLVDEALRELGRQLSEPDGDAQAQP